MQCGFRAIRREVLEKLKIEEDRYAWACEMFIKANRLGVKMSSVDIETIKLSKSSIEPSRDTLQFLRMLTRFQAPIMRQ